jgi:alpha-amylase
VGSWDIRAARHALGAVLRRRHEAYHDTLRAHEAKGTQAPKPDVEGGAPASIHDLVMVKELGLAGRLHYDDHERRSGLVRFLAPATTPDEFATVGETELGDFRDGEFTVRHLEPGVITLARDGMAAGQPFTVTRTTWLGGGRLDPELGMELVIEHRGTEPVETRLGLELAIQLLGGGGNPSAWYDVAGIRSAHDGTGEATGIAGIGYGNDWVGLRVAATPVPAADVWWSAIETVSNSESGFERVYQGSTLLVSWPVTLVPGETRKVSVRQAVTVTRDHAAAEGTVPA